jgi:hypothetical protein
VTTPEPPSGNGNNFNGVEATSSTDAWAVGQDGTGALTEHWNGTSWSVVANPMDQAGSSADVGGVVELSPTDVWTTGNGDFSGAGQTLSMQWNGSAWSVASTPSGAFAGSLGGIARVPGTDTLWTTGFQTANEQTDISQTLALRNTSG